MAKILDLSNLVEVIRQDENFPLGDELIRQAETTMELLAAAVAKRYDIVKGAVTSEVAFGGLCVSFFPAEKGQPCPEWIDRGDESGDWEPRGATGEYASRKPR